MTRGRWRLSWWGMATFALAAPTHADAPVADSAAVEYFVPEGIFARAGVSPYGDLRLRGDVVRDRPGATSDLELRRLSARAGLAWAPPDARVRVEAGIRVAVGSDSRGDPWSAVLNESSDALDTDRLGIRISSPAGAFTFAAGRQRSPLRLTEMIWDDDLRPVGITAIARRADSGAATTRLAIAFLTRSRLDPDDSRLGAVQLSALIRQEAASGGEATFTWLRFEGPANLARANLGRQNASRSGAAGRVYAAAFDVLDVQIGARAAVGAVPVGLRLDLARNVALARERDGLRLRVAIGGPGVPAGAEVGWVFQRVEREAVPGAFNSDDWWFHTRMRGHQVWMRAGLGGRFEARLAAFHERRDDVPRATQRLTVEMSARLPAR